MAIVMVMFMARMQVSRMDCVVWLATFFGCLCVSIDVGLALGLGLGLVFLFVRTAFPKFAPLQRLPGSVAYRDAEIYNLQVERPRQLRRSLQHAAVSMSFQWVLSFRSLSQGVLALWAGPLCMQGFGKHHCASQE